MPPVTKALIAIAACESAGTCIPVLCTVKAGRMSYHGGDNWEQALFEVELRFVRVDRVAPCALMIRIDPGQHVCSTPTHSYIFMQAHRMPRFCDALRGSARGTRMRPGAAVEWV